jgi:hypothetical protein
MVTGRIATLVKIPNDRKPNAPLLFGMIGKSVYPELTSKLQVDGFGVKNSLSLAQSTEIDNGAEVVVRARRSLAID